MLMAHASRAFLSSLLYLRFWARWSHRNPLVFKTFRIALSETLIFQVSTSAFCRVVLVHTPVLRNASSCWTSHVFTSGVSFQACWPQREHL